MKPPLKMLLIFVNETDTWQELPLYEAIVRRLAQLDVAGATVFQGIMGFGTQHRVHRKRLFGVADDRPITIAVVESEEKLGQVIPEIRPMVQEGLLLLHDVQLIP